MCTNACRAACRQEQVHGALKSAHWTSPWMRKCNVQIARLTQLPVRTDSPAGFGSHASSPVWESCLEESVVALLCAVRFKVFKGTTSWLVLQPIQNENSTCLKHSTKARQSSKTLSNTMLGMQICANCVPLHVLQLLLWCIAMSHAPLSMLPSIAENSTDK